MRSAAWSKRFEQYPPIHPLPPFSLSFPFSDIDVRLSTHTRVTCLKILVKMHVAILGRDAALNKSDYNIAVKWFSVDWVLKRLSCLTCSVLFFKIFKGPDKFRSSREGWAEPVLSFLSHHTVLKIDEAIFWLTDLIYLVLHIVYTSASLKVYSVLDECLLMMLSSRGWYIMFQVKEINDDEI